MGDADTLIAAARLWAAHQQPYLATALFAMTPVPAPGLGTFGVDKAWRLYVDPACFDKWTVEQAGSVLVHEVHHLLRDHGGRASAVGVSDHDRARWNVAADLEINDDLGDLPLPPGGCFPKAFGMADGELAEAYFHQLPSRAEPTWGDCGAGAHGTDLLGVSQDVPGVSAGEADLVRQQVAQEVRRRARAGQALGPGLERWAEAFLAPAVDWRRLLASAIRTGVGVVSGRVDYSYSRPSRRWSAAKTGVLMPALVQPVPDVAVVIDTSGSMSGHELGVALAEVSGLLSANGLASSHVRVLSCDAVVHSAQRIFSASEVRLLGGGGTDMGVGLAAAADLRPRPQVVVVITDGFTPWPEERPPIERVIVAVVGGDPESETPEWAQVVNVPT